MCPLALVLTSLLAAGCSALEVSTYNLFLFNTMSAAAAAPADTQEPAGITQASVIQHSDVTALHGVPSLEIMHDAFLALQEKNSNWSILAMGPLSRGPNNARQYVGFIFRSDMVSLNQFKIYREPRNGFETSPFSVLVKPLVEDVHPFVMTIIFLSETNTLAELDKLPKLYRRISREYKTKNVLITGEFHTGSDYLTEEEFLSAKVSRNVNFEWCFPTNSSTMSSRSRFLAAGRDLRQDISNAGAHVQIITPQNSPEGAVALTLEDSS